MSASTRRPVRWGKVRSRTSNTIAAVILLLFTALMLVPIYLMVSVSLRPDAASANDPFGFPFHPVWSNYVHAFVSMNYLRSVLNTLIITGSTAVLTVFTGSMAAWAIVRHARRWTRTFYQLFVAGLTIPVFVLITPLYEIMQQLHLLDTLPSVILGYTALTMPFAVFFFSSFLKSVPPELEEAAAVDGAGLMRTYFQIVLPLLRPAVATLAIFVILQVWNDLVLPLVFLSSDSNQTVTLSVYNTIGTHSFSTGQLLPTLVLGVIPLFVVFLILQRYVVAGISVGAGK